MARQPHRTLSRRSTHRGAPRRCRARTGARPQQEWDTPALENCPSRNGYNRPRPDPTEAADILISKIIVRNLILLTYVKSKNFVPLQSVPHTSMVFECVGKQSVKKPTVPLILKAGMSGAPESSGVRFESLGHPPIGDEAGRRRKNEKFSSKQRCLGRGTARVPQARNKLAQHKRSAGQARHQQLPCPDG